MKSLATIVNEATRIEQLLIEGGGEENAELEQALAVSGAELQAKADSYSIIMERFSATEAHYKERAQFFLNIAKQCGNVQDRLKNNIKYAMQEMGVDEIRGEDVRFKLSATKGSLVIEDAEMVPVEFKTEVIETVIDKKKLKDAAEKGEVPGARIEPGSSLRTYANTPEKKAKVG